MFEGLWRFGKVSLQIKCLLELKCVCPVPFNSARAFVALGSWLGWKVSNTCAVKGCYEKDLLLTVVGVAPKESESPVGLLFIMDATWPQGAAADGETGSPVPYQNFYTHSLQSDFEREHYHSLISTNSNQPPQKCIRHANILWLVTSFRWHFFQLQKQQKFRQTTERNKQTTWEKTRSSKYTLLRCYRKLLVNTHRTLLLFSLFCSSSISVNYTHTRTNTHTRIYVEQY